MQIQNCINIPAQNFYSCSKLSVALKSRDLEMLFLHIKQNHCELQQTVCISPFQDLQYIWRSFCTYHVEDTTSQIMFDENNSYQFHILFSICHQLYYSLMKISFYNSAHKACQVCLFGRVNHTQRRMNKPLRIRDCCQGEVVPISNQFMTYYAPYRYSIYMYYETWRDHYFVGVPTFVFRLTFFSSIKRCYDARNNDKNMNS